MSATKFCQWTLLMLGLALLSACGSGGGGEASTIAAAPSWAAVDLPINMIESVAVSPLDRRVVYAGQRNPTVNAEHAVWRSDDGGESFQVVAKGISFHLFPSPTDPDRVFGTASEPDRYGGFGTSQALYVSRDRGQNWLPAFKDGKGVLLSDADPGHSIGQHPAQRDTIYAFGRLRDGLNGALFKSTDGGASWADISPQGMVLSRDPGFFVFDPLHPDNVFLSARFTAPDGSGGVLLRTVDGGKTWQAADAGLLISSSEGSMSHHLSQMVVTTVPGVLVGVSDFGQLWLNSDGGAGTWRALPLPMGTVDQFLWTGQLPNTLVVLTRDGAMKRSDDLGSSWRSVATPGTILASSLDDSAAAGILITTIDGEALYRSVDAGQTWVLQAKPQFPVSYYASNANGASRVAVSVATQDHLIAFRAPYGSLPRLEVLTGGQWQMPRGLESFRSTVVVSSLAAFGNRLAAAAGGSLFRQDSQGGWRPVSLPESYWSEGARLASDGDKWGIYGGLYYAIHGFFGSLFQGTADAGEHWAADSHFNGYSGEAVFDTANGRFWYLSSSNKINYQLFLAQADGSSKNASAGLPTGRLNALANSPQAPARLYVGSAQGIYRSADGGTTWNPAFTGGSGTPVAAIAVDAKDALSVWTVNANGLAHSSDGGEHWVAVAPEHFAAGAGALAVHPARSGVLAVSAASGIWLSLDAGASWRNVAGPMTGVRQILIVADAINAATDSGLFRCPSLCQPL